MDRRALADKIFRGTCCFVLFFIAASASFSGYYHKWHFREPGVFAGANSDNGPKTRFGIADMLDGAAARPFVYRQLTPAIANWLDSVTPKRIQVALWVRLGMYRLDSPLVFDPAYAYRYTIVYIVTFLFAWLAVIAMYLVCRSLEMPPATQIFAPVVMILLIPYFLSVGGYFYDYPELAFLALAVWMGMKFDWWWMLPLVALATWNKESFLLVTLTLYPILRSRHSRMSALVGTGLLASTCAAVYLAIKSRFSQNLGGALIVQWRAQLDFLSHPLRLIRMEITYGITTFRAFSILPLALLAWIVWRGWRLLPQEIRRHGQIAAAINIPLFFLFCMPGETRDFSMLYIVFMSLLAVTFTDGTKELSPSTRVGSARTIIDPA
ncbi:MAG: hypothetical protein ABSE99_06875 [Terracidiphilus sp.]|jgi:hypothetical protein